MNTDVIDLILDMREGLEEAKSNRDQMQGKLDACMATLEEEFECKTIEEAEALLVKLQTKQAKLKDALEKGVIEVEEEYSL